MDELVAKAFSSRSFTGTWKIQHKDFPQEYWGELSYDPIKGIHRLTLHGLCIPFDVDPSKISAINGVSTTGEKISVFDTLVINFNTGKGEALSQKTVFSFTEFCIGDKCFNSKELVRLRKYSFRCSNLETWFGYHPIQHQFSSRKKRSLGTINVPSRLLLYEDEFVSIKLGTTVNQDMNQISLKVMYYHELSIEAKGNRKLPYYGSHNSFSYYENIIYSFFCLVIGKHALPFGRIGTIKKQRIKISPEKFPSLAKVKKYTFQRIELFNACKIDECWLEPILSQRTLLPRSQLNEILLTRSIEEFFKKYSRFGFVLNDWIAMKNCSSYTNYSLPELLYNLEGLHRSLYPECDTTVGYKTTINAIHAVSPFKDYDGLIKNKKHELPFCQRLQDILLVKDEPVFQFLSVQQRQSIVDDLLKIRNNAAHRNKDSNQTFFKIVSYIFLCEELIAIMIFQCIGLQIEQIREMLQSGWEWHDLQKMLLDDLREGK